MKLHPTVRFYLHSLNWIDFIVNRVVDCSESGWSEQLAGTAEFVRVVAWH